VDAGDGLDLLRSERGVGAVRGEHVPDQQWGGHHDQDEADVLQDGDNAGVCVQVVGGGDKMIRRRERVLYALSSFSFAQKEFGRLFARSEELHTSDAAAIVEILIAEDRGRPLTPARLAERITLSPAATSTLLNRLEEAGDIVRTRGHKDRRVVTLHGTARVHERADAFYAPLYERLYAVMGRYSAAELDLVEKMADELRAATAGFLDSSPATEL